MAREISSTEASRGLTKSLSQLREIFMKLLPRISQMDTDENKPSASIRVIRGEILGKLFQEAQVVLVEITDVIDAVEVHGEAFEAQAKGIAAPNFRIVADRFKHRRIDHATAADFNPLLV